MKKKLFLHVGRPKTGTTALQHFFYDNRDTLLKHNFLFPDYGILFKAHHILAAVLINETPGVDPNPWGLSFKNKASDIYTDLENIINNSSANNILISSEGFRPEIMVRNLHLFKGYDVKVVIYLRRQDELAISSYNQTVRNGTPTGPAENYIGEYCQRFDYSKYLDGWARLFGKENILARVYEKSQFFGGNIFSDFFHTIGLTHTDEYVLPEDYINISMDRDALELKRLLNNYNLNGGLNSYVNNVIFWLKKEPGNNDLYCVLSPKHRREILSFYEESNKKVARTYLNRPNGRLFYQTVDENSEWNEYPGLSGEKLLFYFSQIYKNNVFNLIKILHQVTYGKICGTTNDKRLYNKNTSIVYMLAKQLYNLLKKKLIGNTQ